ncbi:MAG: NAD-dependent epimerase/dehydratase family protein [Kofleriaceae bacterium]
MKAFITGAGGQIGHYLIDSLVGGGHHVIASDLAERPAHHPRGVSWERLDVTDAAAVTTALQRHRPDVVFHLAAILSATGERDPARAYAVNQTGTWNILESCREAGVRKLIFTSSIAVFGPLPDRPLPDPTPDDTALRPTTMYGATKAAGELLCDYYARRWNVDCRGVRFPGLISASLPGGGSSDYALFMYVDGVRYGAYEAFCRPDTRIPLMYMPDGVQALLRLEAADRARLTRTIYNIAAFSPRADEIAASVIRAVPGTRISYAPDPLRQAILDSWPRALDDAAARRDWDWRPEYTLDAMTDDLIPRVREMLA